MGNAVALDRRRYFAIEHTEGRGEERFNHERHERLEVEWDHAHRQEPSGRATQGGSDRTAGKPEVAPGVKEIVFNLSTR